MPGRIGPCVNTRSLQQELDAQAKVNFTPRLDIDQVLPQLPHQRQSDISEQFLTSIDEVSFYYFRQFRSHFVAFKSVISSKIVN